MKNLWRAYPRFFTIKSIRCRQKNNKRHVMHFSFYGTYYLLFFTIKSLFHFFLSDITASTGPSHPRHIIIIIIAVIILYHIIIMSSTSPTPPKPTAAFPLSRHENDGKSSYGGRDVVGYASDPPIVKWPRGAKVGARKDGRKEGMHACMH